MKSRPKILAIIVAVLGTLSTLPVQALQITTTLVNFNNSASVTDSEGSGPTSNNSANLGSSTLSQFDPGLGVLTSTTLNVNSTRSQTTWVTSTDGANTGGNGSVTSSGSGSSNARIVAPGIDQTFSDISRTDSCTDHRQGGCTGTASTASNTTNQNISSLSLDSYIGTGTVTATRTAPTLTATQTNNVFTGAESTQYTLRWEGNLSLTYNYQLHAASSFNDSSSQLTLDLDFGTVFLGDAVADLGFSIYNGAGDRVGLNLDTVSGNGSTAQLTTDLSPFSALAAGSSYDFLASLNTSAIGAYNATYTLNFSDEDVGASSSRFNNYQMTLNLRGTVEQRIPEPGVLTLLGIGLLGLRFAQRKRA